MTRQWEPKAGKRSWTFDRKRPVAAQVYEHLRRQILALDIAPGRNLTRSELAAFYGVSQTPLRDAFLKLEREGLLEIYPQSRTVVTPIDTHSVREIQFLRIAVEVEMVRIIARRDTPGQLAEIRSILARQTAIVDKPDTFPEFAELDKLFHRQLYVLTDNLSLYDLIDERSGQLERVRRFRLNMPGEYNMRIVHDQHRAIVDALELADPAAAEAAIRTHLAGTLQKLDVLQERYPDAFV